ncbi:Fc.00g034960.m01.CDS01 [Cosmosporella sp. VM-42]
MMLGAYTFVLGVGLLSTAAAQTYSDCNPITNASCSSDTGLSASTYSIDFTSGSDDDNWASVGSGDIEYTSNGAEFTITEKGDAPTIETSWYIFFGRVEIHMKAASGTGIVSSAVLLSDDLDELDWEWLGGSVNEVQTNYFGKGNDTNDDRGGTSAVTDTQATSHNYTLYWTKSSCVWYIDGTEVRTLNYADALNGANYPQTPMQIKIGIWAGGDSDNAEGTIEWAGGETDYDNGPFTMIVESVEVTNFNPSKSYTYGDQTGDWSSIEFEESDGESNDSTTTASRTSTSTSDGASATAVSTASSQTSSGSSTSNSSSSTTTTGVATVTSSVEGLGESISPNAWIGLAVFTLFLIRHM